MTDHFVIPAIESHVGWNIDDDNTAWFKVFDGGSQKAKIIVNVLNDVHKQHKIVRFEQRRISIKNVIKKTTSFSISRHFQGTPVKIASVYREPKISLDQLTDNPKTTLEVECFLDGMLDSA